MLKPLLVAVALVVAFATPAQAKPRIDTNLILPCLQAHLIYQGATEFGNPLDPLSYAQTATAMSSSSVKAARKVGRRMERANTAAQQMSGLMKAVTVCNGMGYT